jgi:hypothetical protein
MNKLVFHESILPAGATLQPGQIALAHEGAFNAAFLSEGLTSYAVGFPGTANLEEELGVLAPAVPVPDLFQYRVADSTDAFLTETDDSDVRAIGAEFKTVGVTGSTVTAALKHKGLTKRLDVRQIAADPLAKEKAVASLKARLLRAEIFRAANMLWAAATPQSATWATGTGDTDPDVDVLAAIDAQLTASGVLPNRAVYAPGAWMKRIRGLRQRIDAGGFANAGFTLQQVADFLGVDRALNSRAVRSVSATAKGALIGANRVYLFNAQDNVDTEDPSSIKRFVKGTWEVFENPVSAVTVDITVSHYSLISITSKLGIALLDVA